MKRYFTIIILIIFMLIVWSPVNQAQDGDTTPPKITIQEEGVVAETWAEIFWTTDEHAIGGIEWGLTPKYGNVVNETGEPSKTHYINLTGLTRDTNYYVLIFATDANNNTGYKAFELGTYPKGVEDEESEDVCCLTLIIIGIVLAVVVTATSSKLVGKRRINRKKID
jgi:hypothetical protein